MTTDDSRKTLREALMKLAEDGVAAQDVPDPRIESIRDKLAPLDWSRRVTPIFPQAIAEEFARTNGIKLMPKHYIGLAPVKQGGVALLSHLTINANFNEPATDIRIGIVSFFMHGEELKSLSMRFEPPEGHGGGKHDFYHAQFTRLFCREHPVPGCADWLPDSELAFPIDASDGMELFVASIVHIYSATIIPILTRDVPSIVEIVRNMKLAAGLRR